MTPCQLAGYKVGDRFEIRTGAHNGFNKGDLVYLVEDDETDCPLFGAVNNFDATWACDGGKGLYLHTHNVNKVEEAPQQPEPALFIPRSDTWTSEQYIEFHKDACVKMIEITARKNADYTAGRNADAFANFRFVDKLGVCSAEQGFLTRMTDKLARLVSLVTGHQTKVKDESLEDTLLDLANYCLLLAGYLKSKQGGK